MVKMNIFKENTANLSFGRSGSTVQIYNMNKLGFKYFDYQQTVEDRFDAGFNVLIAVLRNPVGRLQSSHKRRLENIGCNKDTHPYYHKYRNTFNDVNDYINALKDTHSPHHNFVMDELINNKIAAEQSVVVDYYLMDKSNENKNKIRIIWVDFDNYQKDWKCVTGKELENIVNDKNRVISSNSKELIEKSTILDENKEWINKHSVFKEDYKLYEKICCKNRNSDYPVITNGAGEIINYPIFDNIDIVNFKLDIFKDYTKEYNEHYDKNGKNEIEYINSGQVGKLFQWNKDNKWDHYHITTTQHHFPLYIEKLKKMGYQSFNNGIELCCGTCTLFDYLRVNNCSLMDIAGPHCEFMREKGYKCIQGNLENVPFETDYSDITVCCGTLQMVYSYNNCINELKRITKKGGLILITLPWQQKVSDKWGPTGSTFRTSNDNNFQERFINKGLKLLAKMHVGEVEAPDNKAAKYIPCVNLIFENIK
jgi:hypothetical protein